MPEKIMIITHKMMVLAGAALVGAGGVLFLIAIALGFLLLADVKE
jgi:hypothetical protein